MYLECQRAYWHGESSLGRWQTADPIKVEFEELEQNMSKLLIEELDIPSLISGLMSLVSLFFLRR